MTVLGTKRQFAALQRFRHLFGVLLTRRAGAINAAPVTRSRRQARAFSSDVAP